MNNTTSRIPKKFLSQWYGDILKELYRRRVSTFRKKLVLVFVSKSEIQSLNRKFRKKDKPTDVLSFSSREEETLGELVLCLPILKIQSQEHGLTLKQEMGYMVLHGVLHLLGYDHEKSKAQAKKMFSLQDSIFKKLQGLYSLKKWN